MYLKNRQKEKKNTHTKKPKTKICLLWFQFRLSYFHYAIMGLSWFCCCCVVGFFIHLHRQYFLWMEYVWESPLTQMCFVFTVWLILLLIYFFWRRAILLFQLVLLCLIGSMDERCYIVRCYWDIVNIFMFSPGRV